jgi:dual-specificity kinase
MQASSSSRALPAPADLPREHVDDRKRSLSSERGRKRKQKSPVDWVAFFGGKPPTEIIEIHDDDSPAPPATIQRLPPPTANEMSRTQHVDKKRRVNGGSGEAAGYSTTNTPYSSYANGQSTESLQGPPTTASTSLGSDFKVDLDASLQTGQKRKRTTRTSDAAQKKQEIERAGPKGYLAEYGEYLPPVKLSKKQKDVAVPAIHDVWQLLHILTDQPR